MEKGLLHKQIMDFFVRNFDVRQEKEDELETIESIKKGIEFKGTNLWVLIFATFVASLGLNTNSTAVIIGAMLISPLMGPIMGFGLGLGISDFELIKRSFRNFATATIFSGSGIILDLTDQRGAKRVACPYATYGIRCIDRFLRWSGRNRGELDKE